MELHELEPRDVPATWAINLGSQGLGQTAANISGSLSLNSTLPTTSNGAVLVEADTAQEALGLAVVGTLTVQYNGETLSYTFGPGTLGASASEHTPFIYSGGILAFEDMAGSAYGSDWDYNDFGAFASVEIWSGTPTVPHSPPAPQDPPPFQSPPINPNPPPPNSPPVPPSPPTVPPAPGDPAPQVVGDGLFGRYYNTKNLTDVRTARVDANVNFNWGINAPAETAVGADFFSVRWTGKIQSLYTENYTFHVLADDGVRLWVNGQQIINSWGAFVPGGINSAQVALTAGQKCDIVLEYFENTGNAIAKLEWSSARQARQVVPTSQLFSNTSVVGDLVWLDRNSNGRQDEGESGLSNTRVRILEAGTGEAAVPDKNSDGAGNYQFRVPANKPYQLEFGNPGAAYRFTTQNAYGVPGEINSDADPEMPNGRTGTFYSRAAWQTDSTWDAGVKVVFDLDVNADKDLNDSFDGAGNYTPGYEGNTPKITHGESFNDPSYFSQRLMLGLKGIGSDDTQITKIVFRLQGVSTYSGYASNRSDAQIEGEGKTADFSFRRFGDEWTITLTPTSVQAFEYGYYRGGEMDPNYTWVNLYCKDYGAKATAYADVYVDTGTGEHLQQSLELAIPRDTDSDGLADKWEIEMGRNWSKQYGLPALSEFEALMKFAPSADGELADPDGSGPLVAQAESGDAHTVLEEYRGYMLDGGGKNGQARSGHIRLDPSRKEILVEVDRAAVINNIPEIGLKGVLNGAAGVFSNAERGAGIYMYWLMDETDLNLPVNDVNSTSKVRTAWSMYHDTSLARSNQTALLKADFVHLIFVDDMGVMGPGVSSAYTFPDLEKRGAMVAPTSLLGKMGEWGLNREKFNEALMCTTAHEITHLLYNKSSGAFATNSHTLDPNGNGIIINDAEDYTCIMYTGDPTPARMELATVKYFPVLQSELRVKTNGNFELE